MTRGPLLSKVNTLLSKIFPSEMTPNIYAYPEVKIINYLDAQYYGYIQFNLDKSTSELLLKPLELCSTLDLPTCGSPLKSASYLPPATCTDISTLPRAPPTSTTVPSSTSHTAQEQSQDSSDKTLPSLLGFKPETHCSPKSPPCTESAFWLPNSTVS